MLLQKVHYGLVQLECGKFPYSKMLNNGAFNPKQNSQFISKVCFIVHLLFVSLQDKCDSIKKNTFILSKFVGVIVPSR